MSNKYGDHEYLPTPPGLVLAGLKALAPSPALFVPKQGRDFMIILDVGAGQGEWGKPIRDFYGELPYLVGVEPYQKKPPTILGVEPYNYWVTEDFLDFLPDYAPDLICSNPPFSLAEEFVAHSFNMLEPGGHLLYLLRLAFLEGQGRGDHFWPRYPLHNLAVCSQRPSFTGNGNTDTKTAYAMFQWIKNDPNPLPIKYLTHWR